MMRHIVLLLAAIMIACAQEPDLHLNLEERSPPAFSFSGRTPATVFEILEVPRTKPLSKIDPFKVIGEAVWKISSSRKTKAADWPSVVYGEIPSGFSQSFPEGPPANSARVSFISRGSSVNEITRVRFSLKSETTKL